MAHFYGKVSGIGKVSATRTGSKNSGLVATAQTWTHSIEVRLCEADGEDYYKIIVGDLGSGKNVILHGGRFSDLKIEEEKE